MSNDTPTPPKKNPHAVQLGRLGGKAAAVNKEQRRAIAQAANRARWAGHVKVAPIVANNDGPVKTHRQARPKMCGCFDAEVCSMCDPAR